MRQTSTVRGPSKKSLSPFLSFVLSLRLLSSSIDLSKPWKRESTNNVNMAASQRARLELLRHAIRGEELTKVLEQDACVPKRFLQQYGTDLLSWMLDKPTGREVVDPIPPHPLLFKPCPLQFLHDHPIALDKFDDAVSRSSNMKFCEYDPSWDSSFCCDYIADYIFKWAHGGQIPRKLPAKGLYLFMHHGIRTLR